MAEAKMLRLLKLGKFTLYYANRTVFLNPGLYVWTGSDNVRVFPLPKKASKL